MLPVTDRMRTLYKLLKPYLDEHLQLNAGAPDEVKEAYAELQRLGKEQLEFSNSL